VRRIREQAAADAAGGGIPQDCTWSADDALLGPPVGRPATIWDMTGNYPARATVRQDRAKGFDTFTIIGPWFVTADEIPDPHQLRIRFWVNGELRQDGSTAEMFHPIPGQLAWLTSVITVAPGDVVATGTLPGVSSIRPGDELRGEIEGLGPIANKVIHARDLLDAGQRARPR
jgi:2-keto-4-pentenoate hydratase/2-oxohepta-3-ene-1,7-dioic acid hydratase in catechol pathway